MDVSNVVFGDALHLPTCHVPIFSEAKKRAHLLKGETQLACPSDEDQAPLIFVGIEPVSAFARKVNELKRLERVLSAMVTQCRGDDTSDCAILDALAT